MDKLPDSFYITIGILVVANLGVILTLLSLIFKAGSFVAATNMGIVDAKDCAVRAHKRLDDYGGNECKI